MGAEDGIGNLLPDLIDLYNNESAAITLGKLRDGVLCVDKDGNVRTHRRYKDSKMTLVAIELTKLVTDSNFDGKYWELSSAYLHVL